MAPANRKINHSYESEPSSSSGCADDITLTDPQNIDSDIQPRLTTLVAIQNFAESTPPSLTSINHSQAPNKSKVTAFISRSKESDFDGFSDSSGKRRAAEIIRKHYDDEVPLRSSSSTSPVSSQELSTIVHVSPLSALKVGTSPDRKCSSAELSNQDVRCRREMENRKFNLHHLIANITEVSGCSIEPNSSDDDRSSVANSVKPIPAQPIFTNDNSCNAVDNKLSTHRPEDAGAAASNELSFNNIIQTIAEENEAVAKRTHMQRLSLLQDERIYMQRNELSPDMFARSETDEDDDDQLSTKALAGAEDFPSIADVPAAVETNARRRHIYATEKIILSRIHSSLSGVVPPPSVTIPQIDINEMLTLYRENYRRYTYDKAAAFNTTPEKPHTSAASRTSATALDTPPKECLFRPTHFDVELQQLRWPTCFAEARGHGIYYNRSVISENIELFCMKFAERNIGAETSSSFTFDSPSSCKKRNLRMKLLTKSPGNRLSHLAKRRAIFSSANILKSSGSTVEASKLGKSQFVIDTRKCDRRGKTIKVKTPKRRTPGRLRTPGKPRTPGSARKRTVTVKTVVPPTRESSKRALFQSPPKEKPKPVFAPEVASRVEKSKRALFSPPSHALKRHPSVRSPPELPAAKRARSDDAPRSVQRHGGFNVENLTPRSLMAKSQSFCAATMVRPSESYDDKSFARANSEQVLSSRAGMPQQLSQLHKQKMLWAVGTSLQRKGISSKDEHYRKYAAVLVKVVRRFFMELPSRRTIGTSETMRSLADKHVFWVLQGKNEDEIYLSERQKMDSAAANRLPKVSGYVGHEEYEQRAKQIAVAAATMRRSTSSLFLTENSMESCGQPSCGTTTFAQSSEHLSQLSSQSGSCFSHRQGVNSNNNNNTMSSSKPVLTNSSSKSNSKNSVLRENYDTDQRQKSGQKAFLGFSGKDQKNVSPYNDKVRSSLNKKLLIGGGGGGANIMKAKRQISFDS